MFVWPPLLVLVFPMASSHSPPGSLAQLLTSVLRPQGQLSLGREAGACPGHCDNILMCRLQGGQVIGDRGGCSGLLTVCCQQRGRRARSRHHHHHGSSPSLAELSRTPRQLAQDYKVRQVRNLPLSSDSHHSSLRSKVITRSRPPLELTNDIPDIGDCGRSAPAASRRILGGQEAGPGQFPWTALIKITSPLFAEDKMCAGTLIRDRYILTAGHCVHYCRDGMLPNCSDPIPVSQITFKVILGQHDLLRFPKDDSIQRYHATEVFLHPDFTNVFRLRDDGFLESEPTHDVALLRLDRQVKPRANIGSICLPEPSLDLEPGTLATVTGWGRLGVSEGAPHSATLQAVTVPVLTSEACSVQPGATRPSADQVCAGTSFAEQSACPGDSGGPLMIRDSDLRWTIIGIVSTGPAECGATPVFYHRVMASVRWVLDTVTRGRP